MTMDPSTTLEQAKAVVNDALRNGKGIECPCCTQWVDIYSRTITHKQAATLILLYQAHPVGAVVDINKFIDSLPDALGKELLKGREWHKLVYWGLLEDVIVDERMRLAYKAAFPTSKAKKLTLHTLTPLGAQFVFKGTAVPKKAVIFNNRVIGWSDNSFTTCNEALKKKFDYDELMDVDVSTVGRIL